MMVAFYFIAFAAISGVVCFISVILNSLVCLLYYKTNVLLDSFNVFILSVAIGDLLNSIVSLVILTVSNAHGKWMFGEEGCKFYAFVTSLSALGSLFHLTAGAYERHYTIVKSFQSERAFTRRKAVLLSLAMWLYALLWSVMPLLGWSSYELEGIGTSCSVNWRSQAPKEVSFVVCLILGCYVLPVTILIVFHIKTYLAIREGSKRARQNWGKASKITLQIVASERKMAVLFAVMSAAFLIAWTPYAVISLISIFHHEWINDMEATIPAYIAKFSACYNPIIYVFLYKRFRRSLYHIVRCHVGLQPDEISVRYKPNKAKSSGSFLVTFSLRRNLPESNNA